MTACNNSNQKVKKDIKIQRPNKSLWIFPRLTLLVVSAEPWENVNS